MTTTITEKDQLWNKIDKIGDMIDAEGYAGRLFWKAAEDKDLDRLKEILEEEFLFYIPEIDEYLKQARECCDKLAALS